MLRPVHLGFEPSEGDIALSPYRVVGSTVGS